MSSCFNLTVFLKHNQRTNCISKIFTKLRWSVTFNPWILSSLSFQKYLITRYFIISFVKLSVQWFVLISRFWRYLRDQKEHTNSKSLIFWVFVSGTHRKKSLRRNTFSFLEKKNVNDVRIITFTQFATILTIFCLWNLISIHVVSYHHVDEKHQNKIHKIKFVKL